MLLQPGSALIYPSLPETVIFNQQVLLLEASSVAIHVTLYDPSGAKPCLSHVTSGGTPELSTAFICGKFPTS